MKTYNFDGYKLTLKDEGFNSKQGKHQVNYTFKNPGGKIIFSNNDFFASPLHKPESKDSAIALLGFLTCKPGDTDSEYFDNYTQDQLDFANSQDCENLSIFIYDWEDKH